MIGPKRKENLWIGYFLEMHQNSHYSLMSIAKCLKAQDYRNVDGNVWNFYVSAKLCPC